MKRVSIDVCIGSAADVGVCADHEAGSNTDQANVKGCLGGSDGNCTVAIPSHIWAMM
jgi:hypothetical protein